MSSGDRWTVLVTGSRDWTDRETIGRVLAEYPHGSVLIHGDAKGADRIAAGFGALFNVVAMPAQWKRHGKQAGPLRNDEMLTVLCSLKECGYRIRVEAFPHVDSVGTRHMMRIAKEAGVEVRVHAGK